MPIPMAVPQRRTKAKKTTKQKKAVPQMQVTPKQEQASPAPPIQGSFASKILHEVEQDLRQEHQKKKSSPRWKVASIVLLVLLIGSFFYNPFQPNNAENNSEENSPQFAAASDDPKISLVVLNDATCSSCDASQVIDTITSQIFPTTKVTELDISSAEGKKLMDKYHIQSLPTFVFDSRVEEAANFELVKETLLEQEDSYLISPSAIPIGRHLNPSKGSNPYFGKKDAPVTMIEFSDFQCPFSKMFFEQAYPQLKEEYIKTGKVKLYLRDFPLPIHPLALSAAEAVRCAGSQDKFWAMHDKIFKNQDALDVDSLKKYAGELSLDMAAFNACLDSGTHRAAVQQDVANGAAIGVGGTPTFFINGIIITGALPYEEFKAVIDQELKKLEIPE